MNIECVVVFLIGVVHQLSHALGGKGDWTICDCPNTINFFYRNFYNTCGKKVVFWMT